MVAQPWPDFLRLARPAADWDKAGTILCLDPGETTGWAIFEQGILFNSGQWYVGDSPAHLAAQIHNAVETFTTRRDSLIVYEEYRIRGNKAKEHIGSEVITIQHIGAIKVAADELGLPTVKQSAGMAKEFATDAKLRRWGLYRTGLPHANDAIRHGCRYLLFNYGRQMPPV